METTYIKTPLGITKIIGDENGISEISVLDEGEISDKIPLKLQEAVNQLRDYFEKKRTDFTFKLNPKGTDFQQKVWQELVNIPFGKTMSYLDLAKKLGDPKVIRAAASANGCSAAPAPAESGASPCRSVSRPPCSPSGPPAAPNPSRRSRSQARPPGTSGAARSAAAWQTSVRSCLARSVLAAVANTRGRCLSPPCAAPKAPGPSAAGSRCSRLAVLLPCLPSTSARTGSPWSLRRPAQAPLQPPGR